MDNVAAVVSAVNNLHSTFDDFIKEYRKDHKELCSLVNQHSIDIALLKDHNGAAKTFMETHREYKINSISDSMRKAGDIIWKIIEVIVIGAVAARLLSGGGII